MHVPVADLLPTLLTHLDQRLATSGLEHGGWVLQRLGEPPLDEDLGTAALGLYDGDIVHLRPRDEQLPPIDFDDLVDGVATGIAERKDRWKPEFSKQLARAGGVVTGLVGLWLTATLSAGTPAARLAGAVAVILVVGAICAARAFGDRGSATALALLGTAYAALSGLALPVLAAPITFGRISGAVLLFAASGFVALAALVVRFGLGSNAAACTAMAVTSTLLALTALLRAEVGLSAAGSAALLVPVVLFLGYFVPTFGTNAAGLAVPALPATPDEFQENLNPESSADVLRRTGDADRFVTALYAGFGLTLCGTHPQ